MINYSLFFLRLGLGLKSWRTPSAGEISQISTCLQRQNTSQTNREKVEDIAANKQWEHILSLHWSSMFLKSPLHPQLSLIYSLFWNLLEPCTNQSAPEMTLLFQFQVTLPCNWHLGALTCKSFQIFHQNNILCSLWLHKKIPNDQHQFW